jgi:hypothetical protein
VPVAAAAAMAIAEQGAALLLAASARGDAAAAARAHAFACLHMQLRTPVASATHTNICNTHGTHAQARRRPARRTPCGVWRRPRLAASSGCLSSCARRSSRACGCGWSP